MPRKVHDGIRKRSDCPRKRWSTCPHSWHFSFHHRDREYRYSLDVVVARARNEPPPTSVSEAKDWRDKLSGEIRNGTFMDPDAIVPAAPAPIVDTRLTFGDVCDRYLKAYVGKLDTEDGETRWSGRYLRERTAQQAAYHIVILRRTQVPVGNGTTTISFETKPIETVTKADIEAIREARRPFGVIGCNRLMARLRHLFNWAVGEGFLDTTPFKRGSVNVVKLETGAENPRTRRLEPGEEESLLQHAPPFIRALIVAAISAGCRLGELLSLQWSQVRRDASGVARWLVLAPEDTKTNESRSIPVGPRLRAVLEMLQHAPDGRQHPSDAFVFGNECGEQMWFPKLAWMTTVLRAHGITPTWNSQRNNVVG